MGTVTKDRLLVTRFPYESRFGGEEVHTITLMKSLSKDGYKSFFLGSCPILLKNFEGEGVQKAKLLKPPVTKSWLLIFTLLSPILFFVAGFFLIRAKIRWHVTVLYSLSLGEKLLMTPWALLFGMKVIWLEHARIGAWIKKNPWRYWYSFLSGFSTVVVTSNAMVSKIDFVKRIVAIPCGVELEKSKPLKKEISDFIKDKKSKILVGTVARLTVDKGIDMLVKLVDSQPDIGLIIVGDGPLSTSIKTSQHCASILHVKSLQRGELSMLYKKLDIFVLGSTEFDPFGMVAAEAMCSGTATIVTNECGISDDLASYKNSIVIEPKFSELDKAVKRLKCDKELRLKIAKMGEIHAKKVYAMDLMVNRFEDLIENRVG